MNNFYPLFQTNLTIFTTKLNFSFNFFEKKFKLLKILFIVKFRQFLLYLP